MTIPSAARPFVITRTFHAPRALVWRAWTDLGALHQWFGPVGCRLEAEAIDLRPGGTFHYALHTPHGVMWGLWTFQEILAPERLVLLQSFSDAQRGITRHPASPTWPRQTRSTMTLTEADGQTTMEIRMEVWNGDADEHRTFDGAHGGMSQGWAGTLDQLARFLG